MRRYIPVLAVLLACWMAVAAFAMGQGQYRGQVVNRDGIGQRCQIQFFMGGNFQFGAASDNQGYFYVNSAARPGLYRAVVSQGNARNEFDVNIDQNGLNPSTLVVRW
jgi:hypothetical protein